MNNELFTIRTKLLDYELNGITEQQKVVLSNAIEQLLKDAIAKRDALSVVKIQRLQSRLNSLVPRVSTTEENPSSKKINSKLLAVAIFVIGVALTIVTNIASSTLPLGIIPYLWLSWPLVIVFGIITIYLLWKQ